MTYPFIPARKHGGSQSSISRIVIHATVSPCIPGGARNVAAYFQSRNAGGSAHYVVDPKEIVQCVKDNVVAYHAPPNTGTLGIELCDPQAGKPSRWNDDNHEAMLRLAAKLVRQLASRYNVPLVRLSAADLRAGKRGICSHVSVSQAFKLSDHGDPEVAGPFPWAKFMNLITQAKEEEVSAKDIWTYELAAPWDKKDPKWQAGTHLRVMHAHVRDLEAEVDALKTELKAARADLAEIKNLLKSLRAN